MQIDSLHRGTPSKSGQTRTFRSAVILACLLVFPITAAAEDPSPSTIPVGVAKIDITPKSPIRLSGYGSRTKVSEGVEQPLFAKAMAIGDKGNLSVLITLDAIGVPRWVTEALAERLRTKANVSRKHLVVAASHTHSAPALEGNLPFMFRSGATAEERKAISKYTSEVLEKLGQVAIKAIDNRRPTKLHWTKGKVSFAVNRRVLKDGQWSGFGVQEDGPVDHTLPLLRVTDTDGNLVAVLTNYACHCTTLGGDFNRIHGDWAGVAQRDIETRHPGAIAMVAIGCGADQNPNPRSTLEQAISHGRSVADEVDRLLVQDSMQRITSAPTCSLEEIDLPLEPAPGRETYQEQVEKKDRNAYFAQAMLDRLAQGEELETHVPYPVQTWTFGNDLAMVFLAGEVVVDYAHRFYREYDADRLWINSYCNDVPCYIPSKRLYAEGGYELDGSMVYYGKPARLGVDTEDRIAGAVMKQIPRSFHSQKTNQLSPGPIDKKHALETIQVAENLEVELVAAEPLVQDPIDIAWGADGRLWVVEMADYPTGVEGKPGGRVRTLEDHDGDGIYDRSHVFLDQLAFPNTVLPWRDGALIVTAGGIQYSVDTNGDGRADESELILTGFESGNAQHQFGGLTWGLDHYLHVANGVGKGKVTSKKTGQTLEIGSRDLRFDPVTGHLDPLAGKTQFGLSRDDWGNWFGCNNSNPWWHYPLRDRYLRRNPHVIYPNSRALLGSNNPAPPVYPTSRTISRFNDYDAANRFTSACSVTPYRDNLLGEETASSLFTAEPVHNLVSRLVINQAGSSFRGERSQSEQTSEFFSSTDNWCRPTSIRTGPDGAMYIVDMYREVIEHPEWIPERWQWRLDVRSGSDKGRIYRIKPKASKLRPVTDLTKLSNSELIHALDTTNGTQRDLIHQLLLWKPTSETISSLREAVGSMRSPAARAQALAILHGLDAITEETILLALGDSHPGVQRLAIEMSEPFLAKANETISKKIHDLAFEAEGLVKQQLAYSLGESKHESSASVLARFIREMSADLSNNPTNAGPQKGDPYLIAAIASSLPAHYEKLINLLQRDLWTLHRDLSHPLVQTCIGEGDLQSHDRLIAMIAIKPGKEIDRWRLLSLAISSMKSQGIYRTLANDSTALNSLLRQTRVAAKTAIDPANSLEKRLAAIELIGVDDVWVKQDARLLKALLVAREPSRLQTAAAEQLIRVGDPSLVSKLLGEWRSLGLAARTSLMRSMLRQRNWTAALLAELPNHPVPLRSINSTQRSQLLNHPDAKIRSTARSLLKGSQPGDRSSVVQQFLQSDRGRGDVAQGKLHFKRLCATCHRIKDVGSHVGPDLAALTNKSTEALLTAIIDPNRAVESKYTTYNVLTHEGRSITGLLSSENETSITLLTAENKLQTLLRREIEVLINNGTSLMPEQLEATLDAQSMTDLITYLQDTGRSKKVLTKPSGTLLLNASDASTRGSSVAYDTTNQTLSWIGSQDRLQWHIANLDAGRYSIFFDAGLDESLAPSASMFQLQLGETVVHGTIEPTGKVNRLRKRQFAEVTLDTNLVDGTVQFRHRLPDRQVSIRQIAIIPID